MNVGELYKTGNYGYGNFIIEQLLATTFSNSNMSASNYKYIFMS